MYFSECDGSVPYLGDAGLLGHLVDVVRDVPELGDGGLPHLPPQVELLLQVAQLRHHLRDVILTQIQLQIVYLVNDFIESFILLLE